jgi:hypothetical protein
LVVSGFAVTTGPAESNVRVTVAEAVLPFPAASVAAPATTDTDTVPCVCGATAKV